MLAHLPLYTWRILDFCDTGYSSTRKKKKKTKNKKRKREKKMIWGAEKDECVISWRSLDRSFSLFLLRFCFVPARPSFKLGRLAAYVQGIGNIGREQQQWSKKSARWVTHKTTNVRTTGRRISRILVVLFFFSSSATIYTTAGMCSGNMDTWMLYTITAQGAQNYSALSILENNDETIFHSRFKYISGLLRTGEKKLN